MARQLGLVTSASRLVCRFADGEHEPADSVQASRRQAAANIQGTNGKNTRQVTALNTAKRWSHSSSGSATCSRNSLRSALCWSDR